MSGFRRLAATAVVLAFGVVACGDDVQIVDPEPTPPPALSVTLTPSNVNLTVGDNVNLAVGISGGDPAATAEITCQSSNTDVVTTSASGNNCAVEAVGAGNATITVEVTKGNQTSSAGAAVQVTDAADITPATVSISTIQKNNQTVDIDNVFGQVDVTMNVRFNDEQPLELRLLVDDEIVATQEFSTAVAALEDGQDPEEVVEQITLSFNSAYYEITDEGEAWIRTYNGQRQISAELVVATEGAEPRASNPWTVTFRNQDGFHVNAMLPDNSAMDGEGRRWYGGWGEDEGAEITAIPVFFSAQSAQNVMVSLGNCPEGLVSGSEAPFEFSFVCADYESERMINGSNNPGEVPTIRAQYAETGNDVPEANGGVPILNEDHPFPARIDNVAPGYRPGEVANTSAIDGVIFIASQSGVWNRENWINDEYDFATGLVAAEAEYDNGNQVDIPHTALLLDEEITDGGSSFQSDLTMQFVATNNGDTLLVDSPADLDESNLNTTYRLHVLLSDALGNERLITQVRGPWAVSASEDGAYDMRDAKMVQSHNLNTFGLDRSAPELVASEDDEVLEFGEDYIVNSFTDEEVEQYVIDFTVTDGVSGFARQDAIDFLDENGAALILPGDEEEGFDRALAFVSAQLRGIPGNGAINYLSLAGVEGSEVDNPFATSATGDFIADPDPDDSVPYVRDLTNITYSENWRDIGLGDDPDQAGYWIVQLRAQDKAGNRTENQTIRIYLNANVNPTMTGLNAGSFYRGGDEVTFPASAGDVVEVFSASFALNYGDIGWLVYDRNPGELAELFTDEIVRPRDYQYETSPIPFVRSIALYGDEENAWQPSEIQGRAYSGYTYEGEDFIHLNADEQRASHASVFEPGFGFSEYASASILSDQLEEEVGTFAGLEGAEEIQAWELEEMNGTLRATARGVSGQFANPFAAVALVARIEVNGNEYLFPVGVLAAGDAGQLDSGEVRDYYYDFDLGDYELPGGVEEEQLLGFHAVGLNADFDGLATDLFDTELPDDPNGENGDPEADALVQVSGDGQTLDFNEESAPLVVRVDDQFGDEFAGAEVEFSSDGVDHTLSSTTETTDGAGEASVTVTSVEEEGDITVTATVAGVGSVTFTVTVVEDVPDAEADQILLVSGDGQTLDYDEESAALVVRVDDQFGAAFPGAEVTFSASGVDHTLSSTSETTDGAGEASVTVTAGQDEGSITVTAEVSGVGSVTFTLTVEEDAPDPTSFSTNFSEYTFGAFPNDWTDRGLLGVANSITVEDTGGGSVLRIDLPDQGGSTAHRGISWDEPGAPADVEVYAEVVPGSGAVPVYVTARGDTDDNYYRLQIRNGDLIELVSVVDDVRTVPLTDGDATFLYGATDVVHLRFQVQGDQLRGRAWLGGDAEPATWTVEVTDTDLAGAGWTGVGRLQEGILDVSAFEVTILD
jgi:HSP20 family molecular chaperone IbpA